MKILKKGDPEKKQRGKVFECLACGCLFMAYEGEYTEYEIPGVYEIIAVCPFCNRKVVRDGFETTLDNTFNGG